MNETIEPTAYFPEPIDEIQSHILGVIVGLMNSYALNPAHVQQRYEYVSSLEKHETTNSYLDACDNEDLIPPIADSDTKPSWADMCDEEDSDEYHNKEYETSSSENDENSSEPEDAPLYITTRREFCNAMSKGIKICPQYSTCSDDACKNFHIESQHICPHITRGSYCDNNTCDLIVIRPCRKGKRCSDPKCSFRHP